MIAPFIYRCLVRAHPKRFRERFGDAMCRAFEERFADAQRRSLAFLLRAFADALVNILILHMATVRDRFFWPDPLVVPGSPSGRSPMWWEAVLLDARYALRMFARQPVFTALAIVALALGIGANTAIFTIVNGVLLRPLPYAQPDRLVMLWSTNAAEHRDRDSVAPLDFIDYQKASAFSQVEATYAFLVPATMTTNSGAEQVIVTAVTPGMFTLLGRTPLLGRTFADDDMRTAVIVSASFWKARLGGDPSIIGRTLNIDLRPRTVVGVMPDDFVFPYTTMLGPSGFSRANAVDAWVPLEFLPGNARQTGTATLTRSARFLTVVARLKPGVTVEQAGAEVSGIARHLADTYPDTNRVVGATVVPVHEQATGNVRSALLVLLGGVGVVLLMACVNLANMLLARSTARQKEMAIRTALGAARGRLVRQALLESLILAGAGGALALLVVRIGIDGLLALVPPAIPRIGEVHPDATVMAFTFGLALLTGLLIGIVPAVAASRAGAHSRLQESSRGTTSGRSQQRARAGLIVAEVALAVVLTVSAGLLLHSFVALLSVDPGFSSEHLLTMQISVPPKYASPAQRRAFYADLFTRLGSLPGVTSVGGTTRLPLGSTNVSTKLVIEGRNLTPAQWPEAEFRRALHEYFKAMGIPVLRGRSFTNEDGPNAPSVAVVNQTLARQMFPGEEAVGKRVKFGSDEGDWTTIVGVVGDVRHSGLEARPAPEIYIHYLQNPPVNPFLVMRTSGDPRALAPEVRTQLQAIDKNVTAYDIRSMSEVRSESVAQRRFILLLVGAFGVLALVMAAVGVYGVMALVVSERTAEMGIRLALGAQPSQVLWTIVRQGLVLGAIGTAVGLAAWAVVSPLLATQLFSTRPSDPLTLGVVPAVLLLVVVAACYIPARRAMRIDPVEALRAE